TTIVGVLHHPECSFFSKSDTCAVTQSKSRIRRNSLISTQCADGVWNHENGCACADVKIGISGECQTLGTTRNVGDDLRVSASLGIEPLDKAAQYIVGIGDIQQSIGTIDQIRRMVTTTQI